MKTTIANIRTASQSANMSRTNKMNVLFERLQAKIKQGERGFSVNGLLKDFNPEDIQSLRNKGYSVSEYASSFDSFISITW